MTAQQAKQIVKSALYRTIGESSSLLGLGPNGDTTLRVLMYHKVNDIPDNPTTVPVGRFDEQLAQVKELGYTVVDLDAVLDHYALGKPLAEKAVLITFDDGYVDATDAVLPVLRDKGWPATFFIITGRIGERGAAPGVTVVDDGTLPGRRGSLNIDDEGNPTQCNTLIEDGILRGYLQDSLNARLMKMPVTGNGRRESFAHIVLPRMTNTYMLNGNKDPQEIIASVKNGLYAVNFGGGQVDITSGKFVFSASEAYLIENGKVTTPVRGATLIGNGPDALTRVALIGNDMSLDTGVGTCGKEGQSVPVGVGQPTLRIDGLTVGGTAQ